MAKDWEYAKLSHVVSEAGGVEQWLEEIKSNAYSKGQSDMKEKLVIPVLVIGMGMGAITVTGYQKIKKWVLNMQEQKFLAEQKAVDAEELIRNTWNGSDEIVVDDNIVERWKYEKTKI